MSFSAVCFFCDIIAITDTITPSNYYSFWFLLDFLEDYYKYMQNYPQPNDRDPEDEAEDAVQVIRENLAKQGLLRPKSRHLSHLKHIY